MSHTISHTEVLTISRTPDPLAPTLDIPTDEAFESRIRASARLRLHRSHARHDRNAPRWLRDQGHVRRWQRIAVVAALAAFGAGMMWPVAPSAPGESTSTPASRMVRVFSGEVLASLDQNPRAH
jgi:hypothetical protein